MGGTRYKYRDLCNEHYIALEKELGNESPPELYKQVFGSKECVKNFKE